MEMEVVWVKMVEIGKLGGGEADLGGDYDGYGGYGEVGGGGGRRG